MERESEKEKKRQRKRDRDIQRERQRETEKDLQIAKDKDRERQTDREKDIFRVLYLHQGCNEIQNFAGSKPKYFLILRTFAFINLPSKMPLRGCYRPFCKFANHL